MSVKGAVMVPHPPLIVPGENDRPDDMEREAQWIASVNPEIPLHVTRFFPRYRMMDREITDVKRVYRQRYCGKIS